MMDPTAFETVMYEFTCQTDQCPNEGALLLVPVPIGGTVECGVCGAFIETKGDTA